MPTDEIGDDTDRWPQASALIRPGISSISLSQDEASQQLSTL